MNYTYQQANQMGLYFKTNGKRCIITKYKGNEKKAAIPDTIDNKPVRAIADGAFENSEIQAVYIPNTVFKIGDRAFKNSSLEFVELPANIETIGDYAFAYCSNLEIVKSLKNDLKNVTFGKNVFLNTKYMNKKGLVTLNNILFSDNTRNRKVYIPYNIEVIDEYAFGSSFSYVEKVVFPISSKYIHIRKKAFFNCRKLENISFYKIYNVFSKKDYVKLFADNGAFFGSKLYYDILNQNIISENKNNRYFKNMRCGIGDRFDENPNSENYMYIPYRIMDYCFKIKFDIKGNIEFYLDMEVYDELFEDCSKYEKILYSYTRATVRTVGFKMESCIEYLKLNKRPAIRNLLKLKDLQVLKNLVRWEVISRKYIDYAIAKAEKYGFKSGAVYLESIK